METTYLLTGEVHRYLKKKGYTFVCPRCNEQIILGNKVVANYSRRAKYLFHEYCWRDLQREFSMGSKGSFRLLPLVRANPRAPHTVLKRGIYSTNPGEVLCPRLQEGLECSKHTHGGDGEFKLKRPKLLLEHHVVEGLSLWMCGGCDFLLRVEKLN